MLYGIQIAEIEAVWPEVRPWIEAACRRGISKYDENDIHDLLLLGENQLWIWRTETAYGIGITCLPNYPRARVCQLKIVTGTNRAEWQRPAMEIIESWARENGCKSMELQARPGWWRGFLRHLSGYKMTHVYVEKQL